MPQPSQSGTYTDPEGCICPQDYVKPHCPVHDPDGTWYTNLRRGAPAPLSEVDLDALRGAVSLSTSEEHIAGAWAAIAKLERRS